MDTSGIKTECPVFSIDDLMAAKKMLDEIPVSQPKIQVVINNLACERNEFIQFRFPKSKKKRIRKKWSKQDKNFRMEVTQHFVHDQIRNIIYVSSKTYDKMKNSGIGHFINNFHNEKN